MKNKTIKTVLYVEDNAENVRLMEQIFENLFEGAKFLVAINAKDGIEAMRKVLPDLVLMDIDMPEMTGIEAMAIIQQDKAISHIPVIAVSALSTQAHINRGMKAGFREYIVKPLNVHHLKETIVQYLDKTEVNH